MLLQELTQISSYKTKNILNTANLLYIPKKDSIKAVALFASQICGTPIAFVSIINQKKEWFKASIGLTPEEENYIKELTQLIDYTKVIEIEDLVDDDDFFNHPMILKKNIVYFSSIPLVTPKGTTIGFIGLMDRKRRKLTPKQRKTLLELSTQVMGASEDRLSKNEIEKNMLVFKQKNDAIEKFTTLAVENMTSPLNTITILSEIINKNCSKDLSAELIHYLNVIKTSSKKMINLIDEVKDFYDNIDLIALPKEEFLLKDLLNSINTHDLEFTFEKKEAEKVLIANKLALKKIIETQIVRCIDLIKLSIETIKVSISFQEKKEHYWFHFKIDRAINRETLTKFTEEEEYLFSSISQSLISALGGDKVITLTDDNKVTSFYIAK